MADYPLYFGLRLTEAFKASVLGLKVALQRRVADKARRSVQKENKKIDGEA